MIICPVKQHPVAIIVAVRDKVFPPSMVCLHDGVFGIEQANCNVDSVADKYVVVNVDVFRMHSVVVPDSKCALSGRTHTSYCIVGDPQTIVLAGNNSCRFQGSRSMNVFDLEMVKPNVRRIVDGDPVIEATIEP